MSALTTEQRTSAEITSGTFDDLLMGPGKDIGVFPASEGLLVSDLDATQKQAVMAAIQAYAGDLSTDAATKLTAKYESELDRTRTGCLAAFRSPMPGAPLPSGPDLAEICGAVQAHA